MALKGLKVLELAGLAPVPLAGMILADFGASVTTVDKAGGGFVDTMRHNKRSIAVNLKEQRGVKIVTTLACKSDVLLEPFRPGVMEKLGLGPDYLLSLNPKLIYARLTGYGQTGPLSREAGHDINYLAISGILSMLGRRGELPCAPLNLVGDFAGGSLMCVMGVLMALISRQASGKGQIVDCSMVEGASYLSSFVHTTKTMGFWTGDRGTNLLDSGAHFYDTYRTSDDKFIAVGAIEPQFYNNLLKGMDLDPSSLPPQMDMSSWKDVKKQFGKVFASKTRKEWTDIFKGTDSCVVPVLGLEEAAEHPHNMERRSFVLTPTGQKLPAPAPRLSETPAGTAVVKDDPRPGQHSRDVLLEAGYTGEDIDLLVQDGVVHDSRASSKL